MNQPRAKAEQELPKLTNYTVLEKLAVGGMASIFAAQREGSDQICVIKQLKQDEWLDQEGKRYLIDAPTGDAAASY